MKKKYLTSEDYNAYGDFSPSKFLINKYKTDTLVCDGFLINAVPEKELRKFLSLHFKDTVDWLECYGGMVSITNTNETMTTTDDYNHKTIKYDPDKKYMRVFIRAINQTIFDRVKALFKPYIPEEIVSDNIPNINFIAQNQQGMYLKSLTLKKVDINLEEDYATNLPLKDVQDLVLKEPGLYVFTGFPGTGKSYFIRHLASLNVKTVILQQNQVHLLTEPLFQEFAFSALKDTLLILEDCEKVLEDRNRGGSSSLTSVMLNLTDGILNEALNIKIVVTLNTMENIDKALLRAGRLKAFVEFDRLPVDKANSVAKRIGNKTTYTEPIELNKIYNIESTGKEETVKSTIGFSK